MNEIKVRDIMSPIQSTNSPVSETSEPTHLDEDAPSLRPSDTLETALRKFDREGITKIAVVLPTGDNKIIGWADRLAALNTLNTALIDAHVEAHK